MVDLDKQRLYTMQHMLFIIQMYVITTNQVSQDEHNKSLLDAGNKFHEKTRY